MFLSIEAVENHTVRNRTHNEDLDEALPFQPTRQRGHAADRVRERRADRAFRNQDRPKVAAGANAPQHVVCLVIDALRTDTVDATPMPFVTSLSPTKAVSPSTWTVPAVSSLLTGQYPHEHGAIRQRDTYEDSVADVTPLPPPPNATVLPEWLAGAGYETFGGFAMLVPFLTTASHFATHKLMADANAERLLSTHAAWLWDRRETRTFSYLHLSDLHEPVDPPAAYWDSHGVDRSIPGIRRWRYEDVLDRSPTVDRYRAHRKRLYEAAAAYVDEQLAAYHARVTDWVDDVLVVLTGDHGEGFWDKARFHARHFADSRPAYCVGHGGAPYEAIARVPLAIDRTPSTGASFRGVTGDARTSLIDVTPTVLDAVGIAPTHNEALTGQSLVDPIPERQLLVEGARYGYEKKAVYAGDWKLIVSQGDDTAVGFSLPDETPRDLPGAVPEAMHDALPPWPAGEARESPSTAVQRRLAALGYT